MAVERHAALEWFLVGISIQRCDGGRVVRSAPTGRIAETGGRFPVFARRASRPVLVRHLSVAALRARSVFACDFVVLALGILFAFLARRTLRRRRRRRWWRDRRSAYGRRRRAPARTGQPQPSANGKKSHRRLHNRPRHASTRPRSPARPSRSSTATMSGPPRRHREGLRHSPRHRQHTRSRTPPSQSVCQRPCLPKAILANKASRSGVWILTLPSLR